MAVDETVVVVDSAKGKVMGTLAVAACGSVGHAILDDGFGVWAVAWLLYEDSPISGMVEVTVCG